MVTEQDRENLREAESAAKDKLSNDINWMWLKSNGFGEVQPDGRSWRDAGGIKQVLGIQEIGTGGWLATLGNASWPFMLRTRTQLLALIAAIEAE